MREIRLTNGHIALIDDIDYQYLIDFSTHWRPLSENNWILCVKDNITYYMHKIISERMNLDSTMIIDHKNGNFLDNQRSNLREANRNESNMRRKIGRNNKLGHKNIYINSKGKYRVEIYAYKKRVYVKSFNTLKEAIEARNIALKHFHGEFANLDS